MWCWNWHCVISVIMSDHEMEQSLISAYCDGELNAAERAQAEALLATSAEARAELQAYRKLSRMLHDAAFPQPQANLTADVLQAIDQRELVGSASTVATARPSRPRSAARSDKRMWVAVAASAACVTAMVWFGLNGIGNDRQLAIEPNDQPPHSIASPVPNNTKTLVQNSNTITPNEQTVPKTVVAHNSVNHDAAVEPGNTKVVAKPLEADQLPVELIADLKNSNVGQITRFIRQNQDGVTVFHLMVMDVKPGLASLEMILSAQQISGVDGKPVNDRADVVAVYIEANQEKMEGLVQQIKTDHEKFLALAVQEHAVSNEQMAPLKTSKSEGGQVIAVDAGDLKSVGVAPLQPQQIEVALNQPRNRGGFRVPKALANRAQVPGAVTDSPLYKLLILVEKATPQSLTNQPN